MPNYDLKETSSGALFVERESKKETAPYYRGPLTITKAQARLIMEHFKAGASELDIRMAAWNNDGPRGKYIGITLEVMPPEDGQSAPPPPPPPVEVAPIEDDIPF